MLKNVWTKSTRSGANGQCVEVLETKSGIFALRRSKDPDGPKLLFNKQEWAAFIVGARDGEFDLD